MASLNGSAAVGEVVLDIQDLVVEYRSRGSVMRVLPGVDLTITRGEVVGLVGESGSGKSTLALAVLRLLPANGQIAAGRIVPPLSAVFPLERAGEATYEMHHNRHEGKVGILCLAERKGLGVTDEAKRREVGQKRLTIFRRHDRH